MARVVSVWGVNENMVGQVWGFSDPKDYEDGIGLNRFGEVLGWDDEYSDGVFGRMKVTRTVYLSGGRTVTHEKEVRT